MNPKIIVIDGKTYNSVEEMPADVRQKYEQASNHWEMQMATTFQIFLKTEVLWKTKTKMASRISLKTWWQVRLW
jgi:hypothetical protein